MKKIVFIIIFICLTSFYCFSADNTTTNYGFIIPEKDTVNWLAKLSNDIVSIDAILYEVSSDVNAITNDRTMVIGGIVGRMKLVSDDGTSCYILLYGK